MNVSRVHLLGDVALENVVRSKILKYNNRNSKLLKSLDLERFREIPDRITTVHMEKKNSYSKNSVTSFSK